MQKSVFPVSLKKTKSNEDKSYNDLFCQNELVVVRKRSNSDLNKSSFFSKYANIVSSTRNLFTWKIEIEKKLIPQLPLEIWSVIFYFLSIYSVIHMREICQNFKLVVDAMLENSPKLKERMQDVKNYLIKEKIKENSNSIIDMLFSKKAMINDDNPLSIKTTLSFYVAQKDPNNFALDPKVLVKEKTTVRKKITNKNFLEFSKKIKYAMKFGEGCTYGIIAFLSHYFFIYPIGENMVNKMVATNIPTIVDSPFLSQSITCLGMVGAFPTSMILNRKAIYFPEMFKVVLSACTTLLHWGLISLMNKNLSSRNIILVSYFTCITIAMVIYLFQFNIDIETKSMKYCLD